MGTVSFGMQLSYKRAGTGITREGNRIEMHCPSSKKIHTVLRITLRAPPCATFTNYPFFRSHIHR